MRAGEVKVLRRIDLASKMQIHLLKKLKRIEETHGNEEIMGAVLNLAVYISELATNKLRSEHIKTPKDLSPPPADTPMSIDGASDTTELVTPHTPTSERQRSFDVLVEKLLSPARNESPDALNKTVNIFESKSKSNDRPDAIFDLNADDNSLAHNRSDDALLAALGPIDSWQHMSSAVNESRCEQIISPNASFFEFCDEDSQLYGDQLCLSPIKQLGSILPVTVPPCCPDEKGLSIDSPADRNLCLRKLKSKANKRSVLPNKLDLRKSLDLAIRRTAGGQIE